MNYLALLLNDRGVVVEAETLLRRALTIAPKEPALFNSLGSVQFKAGDAIGAEAAYRQATLLKPDYAEAQYNRGLMLRELKCNDEALAAQKRAVELRPNYAEALTQIGALLNDLGKPEEALRSLESAVALNPRHFETNYYRGVVLDALHRFEEAITAFQAALQIRPDSHEAHYALGNALNYTGRDAEALQEYRKAIDASPGFVNAHVDFNALAWTMGRADLSFKSFEYARTRIGDDVDLLMAESEQRIRFNQPVGAEQLLRRALERAPDRGEIHNALGRALVVQGRLAESILAFQSAIQAQPLAVAHYQELAIAQLHHRKAGDALQTVERALSVAPFEQLSLGLLTLAYRELGDARHGQLTDAASLIRTYELPPPPGYTDPESFNRELAEELGRLHTRRVEPFDQTLRGGTQTMGHLFTRTSQRIGMLRQRIGDAVGDYIGSMPESSEHPLFSRKTAEFSFRGSWSCRLHSRGYHTNHVHPAGWISSVYYVSLPAEVVDERDGQGWLKFGESNLNLGELDRASDRVQPAVGRLVLFPSYFWHGTVPFVSLDQRLTVAFDVVPR